jgi:hypothetical protein
VIICTGGISRIGEWIPVGWEGQKAETPRLHQFTLPAPSVREHLLKGVGSGREFGCAAEDQDESLVAEHFKGTVAKCRAAHSLAVEMVGLFK